MKTVRAITDRARHRIESVLWGDLWFVDLVRDELAFLDEWGFVGPTIARGRDVTTMAYEAPGCRLWFALDDEFAEQVTALLSVPPYVESTIVRLDALLTDYVRPDGPATQGQVGQQAVREQIDRWSRDLRALGAERFFGGLRTRPGSVEG